MVPTRGSRFGGAQRKTISHLEQRRGEINAILPENIFDPAEAIADPAPLVDRAEACARTYHIRVQMVSDIKWLLRVGPTLTVGFIIAMLAALALTGHYADLVGWHWLRVAAFAVLAVAAVILGIAGAAYVALAARTKSARGTGSTPIRPLRRSETSTQAWSPRSALNWGAAIAGVACAEPEGSAANLPPAIRGRAINAADPLERWATALTD